MNTQTLQVITNRRHISGLHSPEEMKPSAVKEKWLQKYAARIFMQFLQGGTPLGIASAYVGKVKKDLATFYDDPLKRMFIEATY